MITDQYQRVDLADIRVNRETRQRTVIKVDGLLDSIKAHGVLNPIIIDKGFNLIAGERRLEACKALGLPDIPCRFIEDLSPLQAQIVELEENLKRTDLSWQDNTRAIAKIHQLYGESQPGWNQSQTAKTLGLDASTISQTVRVAKELATNPKISQAPHRQAAYNMLSRQDERRLGDVMSDIVAAGRGVLAEGQEAPPGPSGDLVEGSDNIPILQGDFTQWAPAYNGQPFSFIHCDFPFGANLWGGKMSGRERHEGNYADQPDDYFKLLDCLCGNLPKLLAHSGHLMFWFSMEHYTATMDYFRAHAPSLDVQPFPLVWHKTDNLGILPDPRRGPRRVYETALIASQEDRFVVRSVSNAYGAPTDKRFHPSTKPEPVLRHFFQMFIDENTRLLDPTCGSGSSLRAGESLGAKVLGLELDPLHHGSAVAAFKSFRTMRQVTPHEPV